MDDQILPVVASVISGLLSVAAALLWFQLRRIISRLDALEEKTVSNQNVITRINEQAIKRSELTETIEKAIAKGLAPITSELRAIRADQIEARKASQAARERLARLEATAPGQ